MPKLPAPRVSYSLYNEDCFETFKKISAGSIDLVLCDPPYGTTQCKWDSVIPLERMWKELRRLVKSNSAIVLTCFQPFTSYLIVSNVQEYRYSWVWVKNRGTGFLNVKKMPLRDSEEITVFSLRSPRYYPQMRNGSPYTRKNSPHKQKGTNGDYAQIETTREGRYPVSTLYYSKVENPAHPTQKPVALMEYLIKTYSNPGDTVLDFAMGSGTTGVACGNLSRNFIGCDNDTEHGYFKIAEKRIREAYAKTTY